MDLKLAKEKIEKLIDKGNLTAVNNIMDFLLYCLPLGEVEDLLKFSVEKKDVYLQEQRKIEEDKNRKYLEDEKFVSNLRFTWDEMMKVLEDAGGVITFRPMNRSTQFSRYERYGHLITTFGRDYYTPLKDMKEDRLFEYKQFIYMIDSSYSHWNNNAIALYFRENKAI